MIIFFGIRYTTGRLILTGQECPACKENHSLAVIPQQGYFHIFWIPVFPISRDYIPVCNSCGSTFIHKRPPIDRELKSQYKTPVWTFSGLIIIGIFLLYIFSMMLISKI
ncbi:zinc-ribbon domain-containing protein [Apibacter muscae]|uniref:zinc-ribbon domain-containing protein n=1 Tax=Apibacter muscae TaxID=2509004 RepID=UPI0011AD9C2F|nr:zinc-ribbon domain-containing protein [Apibacter muscae]TWP29533.1 zinc-ribbon domain-containing protein [Apibacter muscae]